MIFIVISSMMTRCDYDIISVNIVNVTIMKISSLLLYLICDKIIITVISSNIKCDNSVEIIIIKVISSNLTAMRSSAKWYHHQVKRSSSKAWWQWDHNHSHIENDGSEIVISSMMTVMRSSSSSSSSKS